ncbi:MAG: hypothetical protein AAGL11_08650 [Pseudomonadota bacterium]
MILSACSGGGGSSPAPIQPVTTAPPPSTPSSSLTSETDVVYGTGLVTNSSVNLLLDIYQPSDTCPAPRPFVIGIHGGGFIGGSKSDSNWVQVMQAVNNRGYAGISIDYRLVGDSPLVSAEFQPVLDDLLAGAVGLSQSQLDQLNAAVSAFEDAVTAIEWARDNADTRCLDIDRFAIWGSSAGAITALHVAHALDDFFIDRPEPAVVVDYWGRLFFDNVIQADGPPLFILHGTDDATIDYSTTAVPLAAEATTAGLPFSFYTIENGPHGFGSIDPNRVQINGRDPLDVTLDFVIAHLTGGTPLYETQTVTRAP